jgi:hypothetical protein
MSKRSLHRVALAATFVSAAAAAALLPCSALAMQTTQALEPSTAMTAADGEHMTVTVSAVQGAVQYSTDNEQTWRPCTVGLALGEGATFRTALRSSVTFTLPPNQTVTLDRAGKMSVLRAVKEKGAFHTDVGMTYGRTRYEVQAAGIEHESTVRTPNSTLAVRGTGVLISDERPFAAEVSHFEGLAEWTSGGRRQILANGTSTAVGGQSAADVALYQSVVDPNIAFARTPSEVPLVTNLLSRGAVIQTNNNKGIPIVRGGVPPTDAQLTKLLPGRLNFVLRWDGPANLDLVVGNLAGAGEAIYPATGANTSKSGGIIPFDHQGGPHGGIEIASWGKSFPNGVLYPVGVTNVGGATVHWQVEVFLDGQPLTTLIDSNGFPTQTLAGTIAKGDQQGGLAPIGQNGPPPPPTGPGFSSIASLKRPMTAQSRVQKVPTPSTIAVLLYPKTGK